MLSGALKKPLVFRNIAAFIVMTSLFGLVLILTEQLRWLPSPWPTAVRRVLFGMLLVLSSVCFVLFALGSAFQIRRLCRSDALREQEDAMRTLRHVIITPMTYLLSAVWAWAWIGGYSPQRYGAALVDFFVTSYIIGFVYHAVRSFRRAQSARAMQTTGGNLSAASATPRIAAPRSRVTLRRLRFNLRRLAWDVLWKWFYRRRLSPLNRSLCQAILSGNANNVEIFLRRGADANLRLYYNSPLLILSAGEGQEEIVRLLLDAGADINAVSSLTEATALAFAAIKGLPSVVRLLLERGAAVDAPSGSGATPLTHAASEGQTECVRLLLTHHADVNAATNRGMTALMFAAHRGNEEAVRLLLDASADTDARSQSGRTALDWAEKSQHQAVVELLRQRQSNTGAAND